MVIDPTAPKLPEGIALPHDRPFTMGQAAALGVTRAVIRRLLKAGALRPVLKGVCVSARVPDGLLVRAQALTLIVPDDAVVTDWTACWLWTGMLPFGQHTEIPPVSIFRFAGGNRLRNGVCVSGERTFLPEDLTYVEGVRVTTPLRTALDIGRFSSRDLAICGMDALLRTASFTHDQLVGSVERFARHRGVVQLRGLAPLADPRAQSAGESVLRLRWVDCPTLPRPTPQVPILDDRGRPMYWIDLGVEELRFGVEYDGEAFHSLEEDVAHDVARRDTLGRRFGWSIEVVRRENVFGPHRDVEEILHRGIRRARSSLGFRSRPA